MKSDILITVEKDDKHIPEAITWKADDTGSAELYQADAMAFTVWDKEEKTTLALQLWTKDMLVNDMYHFTAQTIHLLAETLEKATKDQKAADLLHEFAESFLQDSLGGEETPQAEA
jgi:gliding motility-associated protein GldC